MIERSTPFISIMRGNTQILQVHITQESTRKFKLMEEDCIVVSFQHQDAIEFKIGDYIQDEIFGTFEITEQQVPSYVAANASYKYDLKFQAEYFGWKNKKFKLVAEQDGTSIRKEDSWSHTNTLANQLDVLLQNLSILGYTGYTYNLTGCTKAREVKCLTFSATSIFDALTQLANEWECEWWVNRTDKIIYFGKCGHIYDGATPVDFVNGENVQNMSVQNNRSTYANKVYAYGSTLNIPLTYRKELRLKVDMVQTVNGTTLYTPSEKITADMFVDSILSDYSFKLETEEKGKKDLTNQSFLTDISSPTINHALRFISNKATILNDSTYTVPKMNVEFNNIYITYQIPSGSEGTAQTTYLKRAQLFLYIVVNGVAERIAGSDILSPATDEYIRAVSTTSGTMQERKAKFQNGFFSVSQCTKTLSSGDEVFFIAEVIARVGKSSYQSFDTGSDISFSYSFDGYGINRVVKDNPIPLYIDIDAMTATTTISWQSNGTKYTRGIVINPFRKQKYESGVLQPLYFAFKFEGTGTPVGFTTGTEFVVDDSATTKVPTAFYTNTYGDPSSLSSISENRLQMPASTNGYVQKDSTLTGKQIVEECVIFEDEYPKFELVINGTPEEEEKVDTTEYDNETVKDYWDWVEYTIQLKHSQDGVGELSFNRSFILENQTLQIKFLSPYDMGWEETESTPPCMLAGMTFDLNYAGNGKFVIVRNNTYGCMLPNTTLKPSNGDPCVLLNVNPKAFFRIKFSTESGTEKTIIERAEEHLQQVATEYVEAIEEGQFTFECTMNSFDMSNIEEGVFFLDSDGKDFVTSTGDYLCVRPTDFEYKIYGEGYPVKIVHNSLPLNEDNQHAKISRVIGYEMKLDKPYDAPKYTVGETQAYSRLAQIEKKITKM